MHELYREDIGEEVEGVDDKLGVRFLECDVILASYIFGRNFREINRLLSHFDEPGQMLG